MSRGGWLWLTASVIALASPGRAGETVTYSYDALGRLTGTSSDVNDGITSSIGYDSAGNRSIYAASVAGPPAFSVSEAGAVEGTKLIFTVVKNGTGAASVTFFSENASAGSNDYFGDSGVLNFAAGESRKTIALALIDDAEDEPRETISLKLISPSAGSTIADAQGIGTIFDNDEPAPPPPPPPPVFSVSDASVTEGGILQFTVTKSGATTTSYAVGYSTANNTAVATFQYYDPGDYYMTTSSLAFAPEETSKTIQIQSVQDSLDETNETFFLNLTGPTGGATISDLQAVGTIVDDDDPTPSPPPSPGNRPPVAVNDGGDIGDCQYKSFNVLANDGDPDGHPLTITGVTGYGFEATATAVWVDSTNLSNGAQGVYTVSDGHGGTATAILTINMTGAGSCDN